MNDNATIIIVAIIISIAIHGLCRTVEKLTIDLRNRVMPFAPDESEDA